MKYSMIIRFRRWMVRFAKPFRGPAETDAELPPATPTERTKHLRPIAVSAAAELLSSEQDPLSRRFPAFSSRAIS